MSAKMTAKQKANYTNYVDQMRETILVFRSPALVGSLMPIEWRDLARKEVPKKEKVSLRIDADVIRFYRKVGNGYQAEMNGVLRSFMLARLAEVLGPREEAEIDAVSEEDEGLHASKRV
ncbi:BrnA antitoxin family protein [Yoonia sp. MH D7]